MAVLDPESEGTTCQITRLPDTVKRGGSHSESACQSVEGEPESTPSENLPA